MLLHRWTVVADGTVQYSESEVFYILSFVDQLSFILVQKFCKVVFRLFSSIQSVIYECQMAGRSSLLQPFTFYGFSKLKTIRGFSL